MDCKHFTLIFDTIKHHTIIVVTHNKLLSLEDLGMLEKNPSIKCNVSSCKFNNKNKHYCKLETIKVGTHEKNPTQVECTDCQSFELQE